MVTIKRVTLRVQGDFIAETVCKCNPETGRKWGRGENRFQAAWTKRMEKNGCQSRN